ncbi:alpha/beta fold hydrolase [Paraflavisolibacter sp. H34]|uniref:alpha/beta hydrolase n=1 Tax=Huijunlia imazamoxiresistens TaxID=3127457 RepID=UPI00301AB346
MKHLLFRTLVLLVIGYVLICILLFFLQEKLIFFPDKLSKDYRFRFNRPFEELFIQGPGGKLLNGVLFTIHSSKGLVFYLHGNAGSLDSWGEVAGTYTDLGYDVFLLDYPGYGKSEGVLRSQDQLFGAVQAAYDALKKRYSEQRIVVLGYSIGSAPAAHLAAANHPRLLILQAPFYSLTDMARRHYPLVPPFILRYRLETYKYLQDCPMPVVLFHGDRDEVVNYQSSVRLRRLLQPADTLVTLHGQGHNGMTENPQYQSALARILDR